eukprot:TRINITY_DN26073_c0_g1_i1.p1 TRINITY_DN26073_c0_g1~~TRINITY_DN26073_c0_g1_i1.p1  ORF type:complete len:1029 (+),score=169.64 TRINITY_DN26073_c0_g1_i1:64-3150(+)
MLTQDPLANIRDADPSVDPSGLSHSDSSAIGYRKELRKKGSLDGPDDEELALFLSIGLSDFHDILGQNELAPARVKFGSDADLHLAGTQPIAVFPKALGPFALRHLPIQLNPVVWTEAGALWYRVPMEAPCIALLHNAGAALAGRLSTPAAYDGDVRRNHPDAPPGTTAVAFAYPAPGSVGSLDAQGQKQLKMLLQPAVGSAVRLRGRVKLPDGGEVPAGTAGVICDMPGARFGSFASVEAGGVTFDVNSIDIWVADSAAPTLLSVGGWIYLSGALPPELADGAGSRAAKAGRRQNAADPSPRHAGGRRLSRPTASHDSPSASKRRRSSADGRGRRSSKPGLNSPVEEAQQWEAEWECIGACALGPGGVGARMMGCDPATSPPPGLCERLWRNGLLRDVGVSIWYQEGARHFAWVPPHWLPEGSVSASSGAFVFCFRVLAPCTDRKQEWVGDDAFKFYPCMPALTKPLHNIAQVPSSFRARPPMASEAAALHKKWDFPDTLGPFGVHPLAANALPVVKDPAALAPPPSAAPVAPAEYQLPCHGALEPLASAGLSLCGCLSPPTPVSLDFQATKQIPRRASQYCWCYPTEAAAESQITPQLRRRLHEGAPEVRFALFGGYAYLDDKGTVLAASAIGPGNTIHFGQPRRWWGFERHTRLLQRRARWRPVTVAQWHAAGARYVSWLLPHEDIGQGWGVLPHGGFAFLFREPTAAGDDRDCYFPVAPGAPWGGALEKVRPRMVPLALHVPYSSLLEEQAKELESREEQVESTMRSGLSLPPLTPCPPRGLGSRVLGKESFCREARARMSAEERKGPRAPKPPPKSEPIHLPQVPKVDGSEAEADERDDPGRKRRSLQISRAEQMLEHIAGLEQLGFASAPDAARAASSLRSALAAALAPPAGAPEAVIALLRRQGVDPSGVILRELEEKGALGSQETAEALVGIAVERQRAAPKECTRLCRIVNEHFPEVELAGLRRRPSLAVGGEAGDCAAVTVAHEAASLFDALAAMGVGRIYPRLTQTLRDSVRHSSSA